VRLDAAARGLDFGQFGQFDLAGRIAETKNPPGGGLFLVRRAGRWAPPELT
jgi:hypothetical protein